MADSIAFADVVSRYLDGQLSSDDKRQLEALLRASEANRLQFWACVRQHATIASVLQENAGRQTAREPQTSTRPRPTTRRTKRRSVAATRKRRTSAPAIPFVVKSVVAAAAVLLLALGVHLLRPSAKLPEPVIALVDRMEGEAHILRAGQRQPCSIGFALIAEDTVIVGPRSSAQFTYDQETTSVTLQADSEIRMTAAEPAKRLALTHGTVVASVAKQLMPMQINTPQGNATIVGTRFVLSTNPDTTTLTVSEGVVRLANGTGTLDVAAGSGATMAKTTQPTPIPSEQAPPLSGALARDIGGYWPLDDNHGRTVSDRSQQGGTGTTISEMPEWCTGRIGGALHFNGSDDGVRIPSSSSLQVSNAFTISAWIKPKTFGERNYGRILVKGNGDEPEYDLSLDGEKRSLILTINQGEFSSESNAIQLGTWQHIAVTYRNETLTFYINGKRNKTDVISGKPRIGTAPLFLGRDTAGQRAFAGDLDEIRFYQRSLSGDEIVELVRLSDQ